MAEGFSTAALNAVLDKIITDYPYIQLHTGAPGAGGLSNIAGNATRKDTSSSWSAAASGSKATSADIDWSDAEVDTSEDYTHFSLWTSLTSGTFGFSGSVTANAVNATGDEFSITSGGLVLSGTPAS